MSVVEKAIRKLKEDKQAAAEAPASPQRATPAPSTPVGGERAAAIVLDRGVLRAAGLLPPEQDMSTLARQYREIKHPLVAQAIGRGVPRAPKGYLIMIASATSGEGKSFTALNLSLSLAREKDTRVLLVDADVAKPQLSHVFGLSDSPGLLDALHNGNLDVETLIHPTDVPALSFLPAGLASPEEATELLASSRMELLARALGENDRERIVVFDSPPLLQTTESSALARAVGQIVVVVRAESTPQPVLLGALKTLEGQPNVSLVLNQSTHAATSEYYYYYGDGRPQHAQASGG